MVATNGIGQGLEMDKKDQDLPMETQMKGEAAAVRRPLPLADPVTAGLQKMFAAIADEPIPDDFLRLLDEIDASKARSRGGGERGLGDDGFGE